MPDLDRKTFPAATTPPPLWVRAPVWDGYNPHVYHLEFLGPEGAVSQHPLSSRPFYVGRGAANDLILLDDAASTRHFRVWTQGADATIEDLGSRNGTWVNERRIAQPTTLSVSDVVRVGATVRFRVQRVGEGQGAVPQIEDLDLGVRHRFQTDRFSIADAPGAHIVLPGSGAGVTVIVEPTGEIWLGRPDVLEKLEMDVPFQVAGRRFCLRHAEAEAGVTRDILLPHELTPTRYPYEVVARIDGGPGPQATFRDLRTGAQLTLLAENPALLVYILARKHVADVALPKASDRGWVPDEELAVGIWGQAGAVRQAGNLNVLVWRVRRELQGSGFDAWCLEKRSRHMRLRVDAVRLG